MPIQKDGDTFLNTEETMKFLKTSRQTINRLVKEGRLAQYKQGFTQKVYYKQSELETLTDLYRVDKESDN